jgi:hypothetical protein
MQQQELGFQNGSGDGILLARLTMKLRPDKQQKLQTFKEEIKRIPGVIDFPPPHRSRAENLKISMTCSLADQEKNGYVLLAH